MSLYHTHLQMHGCPKCQGRSALSSGTWPVPDALLCSVSLHPVLWSLGCRFGSFGHTRDGRVERLTDRNCLVLSPEHVSNRSEDVLTAFLQVGRVIFPVKEMQPNRTQDMWLPVKPLLKQDKVTLPKSQPGRLLQSSVAFRSTMAAVAGLSRQDAQRT